ncbi:MAG: hypothetical protein ACOY0T_05335 [Myxococcota bacterium]
MSFGAGDAVIRFGLVWFWGVALLTSTARANEPIAVKSAAAELEPLASRVALELTSDGYTVKVETAEAPAQCEASSTAWVSLARDASDNSVVAIVCFDGSSVATRGSQAEPSRFAVTIAEALNGLRAAPAPAPQAAAASPDVRDTLSRPAANSPPKARRTVSLAETLLIEPLGFPVLWGSSLDAEFSTGTHSSIVCGGFFPISRAELSNSQAELRVGMAFVRVGAALRYSLGEFALSGSFVAGPALTWVSATATAPREGGSASAVSLLSGVGAQLVYPERSPIFALALARASLLLPGIRFALPNEAPHSLGPALLEASLGVGVRL